MSKKYYNADGREVTLTTLCRTEPEWAANNIRWLEKENRDLKGLVKRLDDRMIFCAQCNRECKDDNLWCSENRLVHKDAEAEAQGNEDIHYSGRPSCPKCNGRMHLTESGWTCDTCNVGNVFYEEQPTGEGGGE